MALALLPLFELDELDIFQFVFVILVETVDFVHDEVELLYVKVPVTVTDHCTPPEEFL